MIIWKLLIGLEPEYHSSEQSIQHLSTHNKVCWGRTSIPWDCQPAQHSQLLFLYQHCQSAQHSPADAWFTHNSLHLSRVSNSLWSQVLRQPQPLVRAAVGSYTEFTGAEIIQGLQASSRMARQDLDRHPKSDWRHDACKKMEWKKLIWLFVSRRASSN